ncbi:MAG TPA: hypothetical protein VHG09_12365, partial [Longimicrobiales bacterium]|nr:hypothetical protein [Longimicrobiales bacterium]
MIVPRTVAAQQNPACDCASRREFVALQNGVLGENGFRAMYLRGYEIRASMPSRGHRNLAPQQLHRQGLPLSRSPEICAATTSP